MVEEEEEEGEGGPHVAGWVGLQKERGREREREQTGRWTVRDTVEWAGFTEADSKWNGEWAQGSGRCGWTCAMGPRGW